MSTARTATALWLGVRQHARTPVLLGLLVGLPAYMLVTFGLLVPDSPVPLSLPGGGSITASLAAVYVAMLTPMVAGLLAGIAGLFVMRATREADARLVIAGYRPREVLAARVGLLGVVGLVVTAVCVAATAVTPLAPAALPLFVAAALVAALLYGSLGVLAGLLFDRLAGVYLVLFGTMLDMFLFQNPLVEDPAAVAPYLPGYGPVRGAVAAAFAASPDPWLLLPGLAYLAAVAAVALAAFYRSTRPA